MIRPPLSVVPTPETSRVMRPAMLTFDENGKTPSAVYRDEHAEFMQHLTTLNLQLDRLNSLPTHWADSNPDEAVLRIEAMMVTTKEGMVNRMEGMLLAARKAQADKGAWKRQSYDRTKPEVAASREGSFRTASDASSFSQTPDKLRPVL